MKKYQNPLGGITDIGDPFVMKVQNKYYLYATSAPSRGFKVWESLDLVDWEMKGMALEGHGEGNDWGICDFWAPEVIHYHERFYMIYSARDRDRHLKIALAVSDSPLGSFKNIKAPLFDRGASFIDGHIFIDDNGTPYLYYVRDCSENVINGINRSQIYVQPLTSDLLHLEGELVLVIEPSQAWEVIEKDWQWNEGPFVLKHDRRYYLMYSANFYAGSDYAIGYATAAQPLGPWKKHESNPILAKDLAHGVSGPGHNSITVSPTGKEMFIVYHCHTYPGYPSGNRNLNIDRIYFENGVIKVKGPTRSGQSMPD